MISKPTSKKILLLPISAGSGHIKAAEALFIALKEIDPFLKIKNEDALKYVGPLVKSVYRDWYAFSVKKVPIVYKYIYKETEDYKKFQQIMDKPRLLFEELNAFKLENFIKDFEPDAIVSLHPLPLSLVSYWLHRKKIGRPLHFVVMTDYGGHRFWIRKGVDRYYVASDEVAAYLDSRDVDRRKIKSFGIPIDLKFSKRLNKEKIFKKLGLRAGIPTFLMMTSGVSKDFLKKVVEKILHIETDFQMAITTKEKETRDILKNLTKKAKEKFKIMGYINNVEEWLTVSDLSISKPGGLVVSESIAKGVPMLILSPVPGQEELNSNYLLENGAAMTADTPEVVDYKINTLLRNSKKLVIMKNHARTLGKPNAAMDIAKDIMNSLG